MAASFPVIAQASCEVSISSELQKPFSSKCKRKREASPAVVFIRDLHNPMQNPYIMFVGSAKLRELLQPQFDELGLLYRMAEDRLFWSRDARIVLPNAEQTHLIPFSFDPKLCERWFYSLLPQDMIHFWTTEYAYCGQGLTKHFQKQANEIVHLYQIPSKPIQTCLEGGNCLLFKGADGKPRAIVGLSSVILSLASLLHQNYFNDSSALKKHCIERNFSPDELRIAKNFYHVLKKKTCVIEEPLAEDSEQFKKWAIKVDRMIQMTKQQIADDLQIPLDQVAFVYQGDFHIDMEMCPGPNGVVFIHDERQMLEVQESIGEEKMPFLVRTMGASRKRIDAASERLQKNIEILKKIGCKPVPVPAVLRVDFQGGERVDYNYVESHWMNPDCLPFPPVEMGNWTSSEEDCEEMKNDEPSYLINFMNGLVLQNPEGKTYFFTTAIQEHPLGSRFTEAFLTKVKEACPSLEVIFLQGGLSSTLLREHGSLHCMTSLSA